VGKRSQTKHHFQNSEKRVVVIIRRHHPLQGRRFEVLNEGKKHLAIRLEDGSSMRIPRDWTDVDGNPIERELTFGSSLTSEAIRELIELVDAIRQSGSDKE
jgi:hypothetical protein